MLNILPTNTIIAAKYMSTFNFSPKYVSSIASIAFTKNPEINTFISKFFLMFDAIPPNTESSAATIAIAKYCDTVYGIVGVRIPITTPNTHPTTIAIIIIIKSFLAIL